MSEFSRFTVRNLIEREIVAKNEREALKKSRIGQVEIDHSDVEVLDSKIVQTKE